MKRTEEFVKSKAIAGVDYFAPKTRVEVWNLPNPTESAGARYKAKRCGASEFRSSTNTDQTVDCVAGVTEARLLDPRENGLVKRFGVQAKVTAQSGVDYYTSGTSIVAADLPWPTETEGGKVRAKQCGASESVASIKADGTVNCATRVAGARLQDTGLDGLVKRSGRTTTWVAQAGLDSYASGTSIVAADLLWLAESAVVVVRSKTCGGGEFVVSMNADGSATCGLPNLNTKVTPPDTSGGSLKCLMKDSGNSEWALAAVNAAPAAHNNLRETLWVRDFDLTNISTGWECDDLHRETLVSTSTTNSHIAWLLGTIGTSTATRTRQLSTWLNLGVVRIATGSVSAGDGDAIGLNGSDSIIFGNSTNQSWRMVWGCRLNQITDQSFCIGPAIAMNASPASALGLRDDAYSLAKCSAADTTTFKVLSHNSAGLSDACHDKGVIVDTNFQTLVTCSDGTTNQKAWMAFDGGMERNVCSSGCDWMSTVTTSGIMSVASLVNHGGSPDTLEMDIDQFALMERVSNSKNDRNQ